MEKPASVSVHLATTSGEDDSDDEPVNISRAGSSTAAPTPTDFTISPTQCHQISVSGASGDSAPEYEPQETICYSPMYLCPDDFSNLSRSSPNSAAGSNISIVGSLVTPTRRAYTSSGSSTSGGAWKLRSGRYSKRRGQDRPSSDRERQPSVCSDSETDSIGGVHVIGTFPISFFFTRHAYFLAILRHAHCFLIVLLYEIEHFKMLHFSSFFSFFSHDIK